MQTLPNAGKYIEDGVTVVFTLLGLILECVPRQMLMWQCNAVQGAVGNLGGCITLRRGIEGVQAVHVHDVVQFLLDQLHQPRIIGRGPLRQGGMCSGGDAPSGYPQPG